MTELSEMLHDREWTDAEIDEFAASAGTRDALVGVGLRGIASEAETTGEAVREQVLARVRDQVRIVASGRGPHVARELMGRLMN